MALNGNGHVNGAIAPLTSREAARIAVLKAMPARVTDFAEVVEKVQREHPDFDLQDIRAGVWALLDEGDLKLTAEQRLIRR